MGQAVIELILLPIALAGLAHVWAWRWLRARELKRFQEKETNR